MSSKGLYYIAIIPPLEIEKKHRQIKEDIAKEFGCKHALNKVPHITLIKPFFLPQNHQEELQSAVSRAAVLVTDFEVKLNGFRHFSEHTLYIDVEDEPAMQALFRGLKKEINYTFRGQRKGESRAKIKAHLTVAYKDVSSVFEQLWEKYEELLFADSFMAKEVSLYKLEDKRWECISKSPLKST